MENCNTNRNLKFSPVTHTEKFMLHFDLKSNRFRELNPPQGMHDFNGNNYQPRSITVVTWKIVMKKFTSKPINQKLKKKIVTYMQSVIGVEVETFLLRNILRDL